MSLANKMAKAEMMGDPGIFGDIWGGIKKIGQVATGLVGGLGIPIVSGVAKTAGGLLFGGSPRNSIPGATTFALPGGGISVSRASQGTSMPGTGRWGINLPFSGAPGIGIGPYGIGEGSRAISGQAGPVAPAATGYHWNKTGYYTKSEGWIEPFTKMVKNRRRNPGNMRALSRSMGRIKSAKKMAAVLGTITIRKSC